MNQPGSAVFAVGDVALKQDLNSVSEICSFVGNCVMWGPSHLLESPSAASKNADRRRIEVVVGRPAALRVHFSNPERRDS